MRRLVRGSVLLWLLPVQVTTVVELGDLERGALELDCGAPSRNLLERAVSLKTV